MHKIGLFIKRFWLSISLSIIVIIGLSFLWYTSDYFKANQEALSVLEHKNVQEYKDYIEINAKTETGLIFYPGGKVEAYAYLSLLDQLSKEGINVYLVKMPFNLAVFNVNAADSILENNSDIKKWYIAGHSLGGAMASQYLSKNADKFEGLIELAAYPLNDSESNVLILYGSNDGVLDLEKLKDFEATKIMGGNHAYFGNYGEQEGDGLASISRSSQQMQAIKLILDFIRK